MCGENKYMKIMNLTSMRYYLRELMLIRVAVAET